jgi:hypothetical protein
MSEQSDTPRTDEVIAWLLERRDNAIRISKLIGTIDKEEWREDSGFFNSAVKLLRELAAARAELKTEQDRRTWDAKVNGTIVEALKLDNLKWQTDRDRLAAENAGLRKDAERLDAIERNGWRVMLNDEQALDWSILDERRYGDPRCICVRPRLREAIDAAVAVALLCSRTALALNKERKG